MKISLRPATTDDATILFQWQSNPQVRQYFHNPDVPDWGEHTDWVKRRLGDPGTILCMVMEDGTEVGVLRLDRRSPGVFTVSVLIDPKRQGEGIGAEALKLGRGLRPAARLEAEVLPGNEASHAIFKRAGYVEKKEGIYVHEPHGKTPLAVFRVNAGPHVGLGHAQRCLALATTLQGRGWGIRFLDAPGTGVGALAEAAGFPAQGIGEDEEAIAGAAEGAQILVVDHYKLDLKPLAEDPGRSWLLVAFDDSGKRPLPVDIVINGSPAAGAISYSALGAKRPLAGATYQILRKDL
ncbi:MAG: GNAT family N-acetyltransferase, partial [Alphaproteobacteria bacterium]